MGYLRRFQDREGDAAGLANLSIQRRIPCPANLNLRMVLAGRNSAFSRVTALAGLRPLHDAFRWLHLNDQRMMGWQAELVAIPAPPFGEEPRSTWMAAKFRKADLDRVVTDSIGNVYGELGSGSDEANRGPVVLISAHLDTVFPAGTPVLPVVDGTRLEGPGACDNAAGVVGMMAIAHALKSTGMPLGGTLVFVGNVGEEGEGDLRGVREIYQRSQYAGRIAAHIVLDGAGAETAVTQALGSRRFQVTVNGPGGHSFTDAGTPNPITVLCLAISQLFQTVHSKEPGQSRTTLNVGTIQGGTSVNSIPEAARASFDFRSTDVEELVRLEVALYRAVEDAVESANALATQKDVTREARGIRARSSNAISYIIDKIGDRPAAELPHNSPLLDALKAVDRHLGLRTDLRLGSTDANIPLALGVPAVSLGAGGDGGGAHTRAEWYSAVGRELGLRRVLLLILTMLEITATSGAK